MSAATPVGPAIRAPIWVGSVTTVVTPPTQFCIEPLEVPRTADVRYALST
jgi:hypothetical protein